MEKIILHEKCLIGLLSSGSVVRWLLCAAGALALWCGASEYPWMGPIEAEATPLRNWDEVVTDWQGLQEAHRASLDLFVWPISITTTARPKIYARSPAPFRLRIYRLGWYGGMGAELKYDSITHLAARNANTRCGAQSTNPIIAAGERDFGLVECAWRKPVKPVIQNLTSGLYLVIITATLSGVEHDNAAMFVVRDDASSVRLVIVNPTNAQAYANWSDTPDSDHSTGFRPLNLYGEHTTKSWPRATKVSFNRPLGVMSVFDFFKTDYPLVRFLEREGIPYTVATDYDLHSKKGLLAHRRSVVVSGHGEYWSYTTRTRLQDFVDRGGNLIAMAANSGYWQIRYEKSPAGLPGPVIVGYKETALAIRPRDTCQETIIPANANSCADPLYTDGDDGNDYLVTTLFRNPPVNQPEQLLFGVQYQLDPAANTFELPVTLLTDEIASMQSVGQGFASAGDQDIGVYWNNELLGNIGWEADIIHPHVLLQMAPTACLRVIGMTRWPWHAGISAANQAHLVLYRPSASSGYVFAGLSMLWSWGLDDWAARFGFGGAPVSRVDPRFQTLTKNMLLAAENGSFGSDCAAPVRASYHFANTRPGPNGTSLILKESDLPGRWSIVPVKQEGADVFLKPDPSATARLAGWAAASDAYDLFVADVNGDGMADLVAKEKNIPGNWYVALGDGESFHPEPSTWLEGWAVVSDAYNLFVADVNGDGKADLVAKGKTAPGAWYVALSTGASFQMEPSTWLEGWAVVSDAYNLFVTDVNGDGMTDLVAKEKNTPGYWYVALSTGSSFQAQPSPWLGGWAVVSDAYNLFLADVNGDGMTDLVAREKTGPGNWYVALSTGFSFLPQTEAMLKH